MENKSLEDIVRVVIMSVGTAMESISSEMDGVMWTLLAFITIDYITGVIDSVCNKTLSSKTGFKGILKKVALLCIVAVAAIIGTFIFQSDVLKTAVAMYYISNEGISILENCSNIGLPIPKILKDAITKTGDDSGEAD